MPTGYTAAVQDGTVTTLNDFALMCARNFGALVHMRDDQYAPIPEVIEPSNFYRKRIVSLTRHLDRLRAMGPSEAQRACQQAYSQSMAFWKRTCDNRAIHRVRYQAMLEQVQAWQSPTPDHEALRSFMLSQLTESVNWDCDAEYCEKMPSIQRWTDWLADQIERTKYKLENARRDWADEANRAAQKTCWLQDLRSSLATA